MPVPLRYLFHGRPAKDHYLPDLHHMRLELEEAATPEGHAVRFGFNPLEFENFSWRGYAHMMAIQVNHAAPSLGLVQRWELLGLWGGQQSKQHLGIRGLRLTVRGVTLLSCTTIAQDCGQAERDLP
jgi:hypothetical protein